MARTLSTNVSTGISGSSAPVWLLEVDSDSATFRWSTAPCNATAVPTWSGNTFDGARLAADGLGDVTTKIDLSRGGNRAELSNFAFRLINADLYSDTLASHKFSGRRVELRLIFTDKSSPSWSNAANVWSGYVLEPPSWDSEYIYFTASPSWVSRHKTLPTRVMTREQFPEIPDENNGRPVPIILGDWSLGLGANRSGIASNRSPSASEVIHRDYFPGYLVNPFRKVGTSDLDGWAVFADHYLSSFFLPLQDGKKAVYNKGRRIWTHTKVGGTFGGPGQLVPGISAARCFPNSSMDIADVIHLIPVADAASCVGVSNPENAVNEDDSDYTELNAATDVVFYEVPHIFGSGNSGSLSLKFWITRTGYVDDKAQYRLSRGATTTGWVDVPTYGSLATVTPGAGYASTEGFYGGVTIEFRYQQVGGFDGASFKIYSVFLEISEQSDRQESAIFEAGKGLPYERWIDAATHTTAKNAGDELENPAAAVEALLAHYCEINPVDTQGALVFDGGDYLELKTSESLEAIAGEFTLAAWVYITESPISTPHVIIRKCNALAGATAAPYDFYINSSGRLVFAVGDGASEVATTGASTLSPNTWYFCAATWDGSTARVYLNGVSDGSTAVVMTLSDSGASGSIGGNSDLANSGLTGRLDELQVWNYERSAATLLAEYNAKTYHTSGEEGLVLLCHFDEGVGNHFRDSSGLHNDPYAITGASLPSSWATGNVAAPAGVNIASFDDVHSNRALWKLATVLGVNTERKLSLEIIRDICNEFALGYYQDAAGLEKISRIEAVGSPASISSSSILMEGLKTSAKVSRGKITDLKNEFHFRYKRNTSSGEYEGYLFCINPRAGAFSPEFCNFSTDAETYWDKCRAAFVESQQVLRWEFNSNYIRDDNTAELACKAFVSWLTELPLFFSFLNSLSLFELEILDNRKIDHPLLPSAFDPAVIGSKQFRLVEQTISPSANRQKLVFRSVGNETLLPPSLSLPGATHKSPTLDLNADSITGLADGATLPDWTGDEGVITFANATIAQQPTYKSADGPTGGAAVYFDGVDNYLTSASKLSDIISAGAFHIFVIASVADASAGGGANVFENETLLTESSVDRWAITYRAGTPDHGLALYDGATQDAAEKYTTDTFTLFEYYHSGSLIGARKNGEAAVEVAAGSCSDITGTLLLGADSGAAYFFKGYLVRLVVYNATLTEDESKLVRESLNTRYGIY